MFVEIVAGYVFSTFCHSDNIPSWIHTSYQPMGFVLFLRGEYGKVTVTTQLVSCCAEYEKKADGTCQSKLNSS